MRRKITMRIDELNVALRARNPWESFDLGFALARHTGFNLYLAFVLPYIAFALLVNVFIWGHPTAAMLIIWWVKPAFDRIALSVVSQAAYFVPNFSCTHCQYKIDRHSLCAGKCPF